MADPIQISCINACTVTVVHEISLPPFQLSTAEGAQIASAILAVWVVGWSVRMIVRALNVDGKSSTSESDI